jgi:hypothetical protein
MRQAGLRGVSRSRAFTVIMRRNLRLRPAADLVNRTFAVVDANQL